MPDEYKLPKCEKTKTGYRIRLRLRGETVYVIGKTERECKSRARAYKTGEMAKEDGTPKKQMPTLDQALEMYIKSREQVLSPSTIKGYDKIKRTRFQHWKNHRLDKIDWQLLISMECRESVSAKTITVAWGLVNSAIKAQGITAKVKLPQVVKNERNFLDSDEIQKFMAAMEDDPAEMAALLMLHSLRLSEVMGLQWENLTEESIAVHGSAVYDINGKLVQKDTNKNTGSNREIPVFIPRLQDLINAQKVKEGNVVTIAENTIYRHISDAAKRAGLQHISPHCLRHSFCSLALIDCGLTETEVMQIGGWSDIYTMRRIYTHVNKKRLDSAAEKLKSKFGGNLAEQAQESPKIRDC